MKQLLLAAGLIWSSLCLPCLADDAPPPAKPAKPAENTAPATGKWTSPPRVQVITNMGTFVIELNQERAPLTVAHFLAYVEQGFYTATVFHRVVPNFVIQGGGLDTDYKVKPAPLKVVNESGNGLTNARGTIGAARGTDPHSSDSQFYINLYDNAALDPNATRWGYAVFGKVIQGMEVVDKIGNVSTGSHGAIKEDVPLKPVIIERIERVNAP
jgi:cyclophilin family peptidyl-prolyl cis-trans isomerase